MRWRANPFILFEGEQFPVLGGMFMLIFQIGKDPCFTNNATRMTSKKLDTV